MKKLASIFILLAFFASGCGSPHLTKREIELQKEAKKKQVEQMKQAKKKRVEQMR